MKLLNEIDPGASAGTPPASATVHVVKPLPPTPSAETRDSGARPESLHIEYSSTQVMTDALVRLQRTHGVVKMDRSALAESFKMLRNQVLQRMRADGHTVLAVTSPRRIEGKSLTAVNLALSIAADYDSAVLLVDADLTGHGLQTLFGLDAARGLAEHLMQGVPIPDLLVNPGVPRFVLLPAGQRSELNSAELLATKAAQQLVREMKLRYQDRYIIVDLPPLLDTADTLAFLPQADTTLVVVEEHTSSIQDMETMAELLAPFNLLGTVMSRARQSENPNNATRQPWYRCWAGKNKGVAQGDR
jgi:protein-tyrosine kinase